MIHNTLVINKKYGTVTRISINVTINGPEAMDVFRCWAVLALELVAT